MALDFDGPPIYDPITQKSKDYISDIWITWLSTFGQTLAEYLSQNGIFLPLLTTDQRNEITTPQNGQFIYNININAPQFFQSSSGTWRTVTFT